MRWEAANIKRKSTNFGLESDGTTARDASTRKRSSETAEAALSRLTKSYSTAISCIGALRRASNAVNAAIHQGGKQKERQSGESNESIGENEMGQLRRVANAARSTLENSILLDLLISSHTPTLSELMRNIANNEFSSGNDSNRWEIVRGASMKPEPPLLTSSAHRSTILEICYLSLVNYADLLLSACACSRNQNSRSQATGKDNVLDRGVTRPLQILKECGECCWEGESRELTLRLALVALCDASEIDGTDPTLWLKLACAARELGRILVQSDGVVSDTALLRYRRLERHALECGRTALPPGVPPNRTIVRALDELNKTKYPEVYPEIIQKECDVAQILVNLNRYSWTVLGRLLMRACREGSSFDEGLLIESSNSIRDSSKHTKMVGSPCIKLKLSPVLALPSLVLGTICQYLEDRDTWRFEATCRALSVSIISARTSVEQVCQMRSSNRNANVTPPKETKLGTKEDTDVDGGNNEEPDQQNPNQVQTDLTRTEDQARSHRSSKRVRSKVITSGKLAERKAKRNSVEFCLLASILSCTSDDREYLRLVKEDLIWENLLKTEPCFLVKGEHSGRSVTVPRSANELQLRHREEAIERSGSASLTSFIQETFRNSGPAEVLAKFVTHIALNVEAAFSSDPSGMMATLTTCVAECIDLLNDRSGFSGYLSATWYGHEPLMTAESIEEDKKVFAINLLNAELRLKRCERQSFDPHDDRDFHTLSALVPLFLRFMEGMDIIIAENTDEKTWSAMKTRANWFVAGFYLWRSRIAQQLSEASLAESLGLQHIEETIKCLKTPPQNPVGSVRTPHLESPGRIGSYWKLLSINSLTDFRDKIQASAVVSRAREQFLEAVAGACARGDEDLSMQRIPDLSAVGKDLFGRYDTKYEGLGGKHEELLNDFLALHGDGLASSGSSDSENGARRWGDLWRVVPSTIPQLTIFKDITNPSILTILLSSSQSNDAELLDLVFLLTRLVIAAFDQQRSLVQNKSSSGNSDDFSDSDDSLDSDDKPTEGGSLGKEHVSNARLYCLLAQLFIDKIADVCSNHHLAEEHLSKFIDSSDYEALIHLSLGFSAEWYSETRKTSNCTQSRLDLEVFVAIRSLVAKLLGRCESDENKRRLETSMLAGLSRIVISQREVFPLILRSHGDNRAGRAARQRLCATRAEYVGAVACETALLLSRNRFDFRNDGIAPSPVLEALFCSRSVQKSVDGPGERRVSDNLQVLSSLCESLLWFVNYSTNTDYASESQSLRAPVAAVVVALCGAAPNSALSRKLGVEGQHGGENEPFSLAEFYDSDDSVHEWQSDSDSEGFGQAREDSFRIICQAIQCAALVFGGVNDKDACASTGVSCTDIDHGPVLPLVVARVLNHYSDVLLSEFGLHEKGVKKFQKLWAEQYPRKTRTIGALLDASLHRVYRCLHGFSLVSANVQANAITDPGSSLSANEDVASKHYAPESTAAAASLYRCIMRAYATSRKSPPKASLECVMMALPKLEESERSKTVKRFLFSSDTRQFGPSDVKKVVERGINWHELFESLPEWVWETENYSRGKTDDVDPLIEEVALVRKGLYRELAKGPIPSSGILPDDNSNKSKDSKDAEERTASASHEQELAKKFHAIINDLCYGESVNSAAWYDAGQCVAMKSELIADRLGITRTVPHSDFAIPDGRSVHSSMRRRKVADLESEQETEFNRTLTTWFPYLGDNLATYIQHPWSTFSSLRCFSSEICDQLTPDTAEQPVGGGQLSLYRKIEAFHSEADYYSWQQAWGGMFVTALRQLSVRCMCVALFLLFKKTGEGPDEASTTLISEICESLGTAHYSMLQGSQMYGYPMHVMTAYRKRQLAETALACFTKAIAVHEISISDKDKEENVTWDLLFMIGKCHEKIASVYKRERFDQCDTDDDPPATRGSIRRVYEIRMELAFNNYANALKEVQAIEKEGIIHDIQAGGSSHGALEVFYRLHASRLKCLLYAVQQKDTLSDVARDEALRLVTQHWYSSPNDNEAFQKKGFREKIWDVLADVTSALAHCRNDQAYFHRSVYRHAQALMWAPSFNDPVVGAVEGSQGVVPISKSQRLHGLASSVPCANSAELVIGALFEKKRPQLCAVWVTTTGPSPSPFQLLNTSIRKYDSLRAKYISAYIDSLRLCNTRRHRQDKLETLLEWASSSKRDLPAFYEASALAGGGPPASSSHVRDCLLPQKISKLSYSVPSMGFLRTVKRQINSALAVVLCDDIKSLQEGRASDDEYQNIKTQQQNVDLLRKAYSCYLRLNCTISMIEQSRTWKFGMTASIPEVETLCQAYFAVRDDSDKDIHIETTTDQMNWSGGAQNSAVLKAAIEKCQYLFPTLSSSTLAKKKKYGKKRQASTESNASSDANNNNAASSDRPEEPPMSSPSMGPTKRKAPSPISPLPKDRHNEKRGNTDNKAQQFSVVVPEGLSSGDTFQTKVRVGDITRLVKLKVPAGNPSKLKFTLSLPAPKSSSGNDEQQQQQQVAKKQKAT